MNLWQFIVNKINEFYQIYDRIRLTHLNQHSSEKETLNQIP